MAIKLSTPTRSIIDQWYDGYLQGITGYQISRLREDNPFIIDLDYSVSSYLKIKGVNLQILSVEDLFELTKMLSVSTSPDLDLGLVNGTKQIFDSRSRQLIDVPNVEQLNPIPNGADEAQKKAIFNAKILPGITRHYASILAGGDIDDITKGVLREWWNKNQNNLLEPYMDIANQVSEVPSLSRVKSAGIKISENNQGRAIEDRFFKGIFEGSGFVEDNILDALGFSSFLRDNIGVFGTSTTPELTLAGLETAAILGNVAYADIVTSALNIDSELSDEVWSNLNQCALITGLIHDEEDYNFRRYIQVKNYASPLHIKAKGSSRIYPVTIEKYNPNKLINNCVINKKVKNVFNTTDTKTPHNMVKAIFWVYETGEGEFRTLREAELTTNSTTYKKKVSNIYKDLKENSANPYTGDITDSDLKRISRFHDHDKKRDSSYYFLENTKITFEGTDPSSARNDVQVEMTWKLGSLEGLGSTMATLGTKDGQADGTEIVIMDLITLPNTGKPNSSNGPSQFLTNQYSPNYSRLRLKVAPYGDKDGDHQEDCMILDLAIIDHTINRSSETGETTLTINYRGYFEATLNMPYNDALATPKILDERQARQKEALGELDENNCSAEIVREALRLEQRISKSESNNQSAGTILKRMQDRNLVHYYKLNEMKMASGRFGNLLDGRQMYVEEVVPQTGTDLGDITEEDVENLALAQLVSTDAASEEEKEKFKESYDKLTQRFFFLGDLMYVLLDCLYEDDSVKHRDSLKNLNLRFVMGTIFAPNPKDLGGSPIIINPISIPIDMRFFVQWFNATVVNKGLTHYPIGVFIRDLVERLVNNIIYDTCFSLLMPDENPPVLKSRTFISNNDDWFVKEQTGWFNPENPSGGGKTDILFSKGFVSNKTSKDNTWSHEITSKNYCVIYQQFPSYKRQLAAENNGYLRDDEYTPTIYYGAKNKNYNFLSDVSFSKTNSPFLRESRFATSNYGGLALLSNVYDLSFSFKRRKANTMFYPGCIINFVLLDWGKRWVDDTPWYDDGAGDITHLFGTGDLGDSDPHREGTISNIMGMGGYFIVLSAEYNLGQTPGEFEINITTKFLGTDAEKALIRTKLSIKELEEKAKCEAIFNNLADRVNEVITENETGEDPIAHIGDGGAAVRIAREVNATAARELEVDLDEMTNVNQTSDADPDELVGDPGESDPSALPPGESDPSAMAPLIGATEYGE